MKINPFTASRSFPKGSNTSSTKAVIFSFLVFFLFLNISLAEEQPKTLIPNTGPNDQAVEALGNLRKNKAGESTGFIPCDTSANPKPCAPKDLFLVLAKIGKLFLYLIIISVALGGIIIGMAYPYAADNIKLLEKIKKYGSNLLIALLVAALGTTFIFALLSSLGLDQTLLNIIKQLFSTTDPVSLFNFVETSWAKTHTTDINNINDVITQVAKYDGAYLNVFGTNDPLVLILNLIKFLVTYVAIPALSFAVLWTGFLYVKAQGNSTELDKAHKWVKNCVIGILIAAAAPFVASLFFSSLSFLLSK